MSYFGLLWAVTRRGVAPAGARHPSLIGLPGPVGVL
jgi:hypothetical protein